MIWPFIPMNEMLESIESVTDVMRAFSTEQRVRLTEIPRRRFNPRYLFADTEYEFARSLMRGRAPQAFDLPDWAFRYPVSSAAAGASAVVFDNTYPALSAADRIVLIQGPDQYEELDVATANGTGITLGTPLGATYKNAVLCPIVSARTLEGLSVDHSSSPMRPGQVEWTTYGGVDLASDGATPSYRGDLLLTVQPRSGQSSHSEQITHESDVVDNGIAEPFFDTVVEGSIQSLAMTWQIDSRPDEYALRQLVYALRGRQRAFWLPDWNNGIRLAAGAGNGATSISVRKFGFTDGYGTGDIFIRLKNGTAITRQVTGSVPAGANETLTITPGLPQAVAVADVDVFSLLFRVRQAEDRVEWTHRASPGPMIQMAVTEVPVP